MKITAVRKDKDGKISDYKLDNNQIVDKETCVSMVKSGEIENCNVGISKNGEEFVRTDRDAEEGKHIKNLDDLPTFK